MYAKSVSSQENYDEVVLTDLTEGKSANLSEGPASKQLMGTPSDKTETVIGLGEDKIERLGELLTLSMKFGLEVSVLSTATTNMTKSVSTLMRGQ